MRACHFRSRASFAVGFARHFEGLDVAPYAEYDCVLGLPVPSRYMAISAVITSK